MFLAKVSNSFEVDLLIRRAVDMLGIREEVLRRRRHAGGRRPPASASMAAAPSRSPSREDMAERLLVSLMLRLPAVIDSVVRDD